MDPPCARVGGQGRQALDALLAALRSPRDLRFVTWTAAGWQHRHCCPPGTWSAAPSHPRGQTASHQNRPIFVKWRLTLGLYRSRQAERAAREEEEEEEGGRLGQVLSAIAEGKGRARRWVRMEEAAESRGGLGARILVQERPHQQFQRERKGESDGRSGWIGDLDQRGIQPPCLSSRGNGPRPGRPPCVRGLWHRDLRDQKEGRLRLPGEEGFICQGLN